MVTGVAAVSAATVLPGKPESTVARAQDLPSRSQKAGKQAGQPYNSLVSPDHRRSIGRNAPSTPGAAALSEGVKRYLNTADDETGL